MTPEDATIGRSLSSGLIASFEERFTEDLRDRVIQNMLAAQPLDSVALRHDIVTATSHAVSHRLDGWKATHQGKSGRCWIFAGLNLLRVSAAHSMGVADFEFSQSHTMFWDKLERANFLLEALIETADRDIDDRTVAFLLDNLVNDGGQWHMFLAIVERHGVVPRDLMPETPSSQDTAKMNARLRTVIRRAAKSVRSAANDPVAARRIKAETLEVVFRILALHLGTPPTRFQWQWTDDANVFHRDPPTTPVEFADRYVTLPLDEYVCLVHDPRPDRHVGEVLTVRYLGNVIDAPPVRYLNVDVDTMRTVVRRTLESDEPVWFGCDTDKMVVDELGIWDSKLYDYEAIYRADLTMTKQDRVEYHESQMTHAMIFTGVDIADGVVSHWRVENSWGSEKGQKGFYTMNDNWFGDYVFEVAVRRSSLPEALRDAVAGPVTVLEPWDPMGALATR